MKSTHLTLAAVAALAAAGAVGRRGSANDLTPFQKRLLYLWKQYPPERAFMATEVVRGLLYPDRRSSAYMKTSGLNLLREQISLIMRSTSETDPVQYLKTWATDQIKKGDWYSARNFGLNVDPPVGWEKLIPWIGKEVNRLLKRPGPLKNVPASELGYRGRRWRATLTLDGIRALMAYNQQAARTWEEDTSGVRDLVYAGKPVGQRLPLIGYGHWSLPHRSDMPLVPREVLGMLHIQRMVKALPEIRDWWSSGAAGNIMSLTYEQAKHAADRWHREMERASPGGDAKRASTRGTEVAQLSGGWVIERLAPGDLRPQSEAMSHCVGRADTYRRGIERGTTDILSVRDEDGRSHFTLEVRKTLSLSIYGSVPQFQLVQFKGKSNRIPGLTDKKTTQVRDLSIEELRGKIERARKPFISQTDLERAREVFLKLPEIYEGEVEVHTTDLRVLYAQNMLPEISRN